MLTKRIIPCLDIKDWKVVKWTNFLNLKNAWNPIELAKKYSEMWADELVFLDISATQEKRKTLVSLVKEISKNIQIPFTVWWWISSVEEIEEILKSWADKVSLNSSVVKNPNLIKKASERFWNQAIVVAIDYKKIWENYKVFISWGKKETDLELFSWVKKCEKLWAWEFLLTSMDNDWVKKWFDLEVLKKVSEISWVPIIASGWAWNKKDFLECFKNWIDWALAASVFHFWEIEIWELKGYLRENGIEIRK